MADSWMRSLKTEKCVYVLPKGKYIFKIIPITFFSELKRMVYLKEQACDTGQEKLKSWTPREKLLLPDTEPSHRTSATKVHSLTLRVPGQETGGRNPEKLPSVHGKSEDDRDFRLVWVDNGVFNKSLETSDYLEIESWISMIFSSYQRKFHRKWTENLNVKKKKNNYEVLINIWVALLPHTPSPRATPSLDNPRYSPHLVLGLWWAMSMWGHITCSTDWELLKAEMASLCPSKRGQSF